VFDCPVNSTKACCDKQPTVKRLRWDRADIPGYYHSTGLRFHSILSDLSRFKPSSGCYASQEPSQVIDSVYESIVCALQDSASEHVPNHNVKFHKFWRSQGLSCLKETAIISDKLWNRTVIFAS